MNRKTSCESKSGKSVRPNFLAGGPKTKIFRRKEMKAEACQENYILMPRCRRVVVIITQSAVVILGYGGRKEDSPLCVFVGCKLSVQHLFVELRLENKKILFVLHSQGN